VTRAAGVKPPAPHRATTAHLQALFPFVSGGGLSEGGPLIGRDLLGGPFFFDPWELYRTTVITNPNMVVLGQLGRGKSAFVKILVWRQLAFGRRAWIIDPKGEHEPLARASGTRPLALAPGGQVRLNPLDGPGGRLQSFDEVVRRRCELAMSLISSSLGRPLGPEERTAVELAVRQVSAQRRVPTLPDLVAALLHPDAEGASAIGTDSWGLARAGRPAGLELRRMVQGDLAGMFDGPTSPSVRLDAAVVVLDLSAAFASAALPLIMTCATAWLQAALSSGDGGKRLVVIDEAWAVLSDLAIARWCQATFKLSRALGVANVVVAHRVSDLSATGADGSAEEKLASGLLADCETRVVFGQAPSEAEMTGQRLALSRSETALIPQLSRGVALWRIGDPFLPGRAPARRG
jgi:type IV secretory pathway VirB4 component